VGNRGVQKPIDVGGSGPLLEAVLIDLGLPGLLAIQHSVTARPRFKQRWCGPSTLGTAIAARGEIRR
jgi:methanethiol S-methyltransferase